MKDSLIAKVAERKGEKFFVLIKDIVKHLNHMENNMQVMNDNMIEINKNLLKLIDK